MYCSGFVRPSRCARVGNSSASSWRLQARSFWEAARPESFHTHVLTYNAIYTCLQEFARRTPLYTHAWKYTYKYKWRSHWPTQVQKLSFTQRARLRPGTSLSLRRGSGEWQELPPDLRLRAARCGPTCASVCESRSANLSTNAASARLARAAGLEAL